MPDDGLREPVVVDRECRGENSGKLSPKIMIAGDFPVGDDSIGQPYILVTEDGISLVGSETCAINVSGQLGISLQAPSLSFAAMPNQVSFGGGYWRINPTVLSCLPSTTPTPVSWLVKSTPELLQPKGDISGALGDIKSFIGI